MAKTLKKSTMRQPAKSARAVRPTRLTDGDGDEKGEIMWDHTPSEAEEERTRPPRKHESTKNATPRPTAFQSQKRAIYAAARKNAKEISQAGMSYIEEARAKIFEIKDQESSYEKHFKDFERLCIIQEASMNSQFAIYPALLDDVAPRRSNQINIASAMIKSNPIRRQAALKMFLKNARVRVEEARENEKAASDASKLIKHYKSLLYS